MVTFNVINHLAMATGDMDAIWPEVTVPKPLSKRIVYPGAGNELFHRKKRA